MLDQRIKSNHAKAFDYFLRCKAAFEHRDQSTCGYQLVGNNLVINNSVAQLTIDLKMPLQPQTDRFFKLWLPVSK